MEGHRLRFGENMPVDRNLEFFLTSHIYFLFTVEQCGDNCK